MECNASVARDNVASVHDSTQNRTCVPPPAGKRIAVDCPFIPTVALDHGKLDDA